MAAIVSKFGHFSFPVVAKTADYTVDETDFGKIFTNRGAAGTVIFTTPAPSAAYRGCWFRVQGVANQTITITAGTQDTLVVFNDAAADTWSLATSGAIIGSGALVVCDGTGWLVIPHAGATDAATPLLARQTLTT